MANKAAARGQNLVEYGLFLGLVVVVAVGALQTVGGTLGDKIEASKAQASQPPQQETVAYVDVEAATEYNAGVFINGGAVDTGEGQNQDCTEEQTLLGINGC